MGRYLLCGAWGYLGDSVRKLEVKTMNYLVLNFHHRTFIPCETLEEVEKTMEGVSEDTIGNEIIVPVTWKPLVITPKNRPTWWVREQKEKPETGDIST